MHIGQKIRWKTDPTLIETIIHIKKATCKCDDVDLILTKESQAKGWTTSCGKCGKKTNGAYFNSTLFISVGLNDKVKTL